MKVCRFDENRLGIIEGGSVADVTSALDVIPPARYPLPKADLMLLHFDAVLARASALLPTASRLSLASVHLLSPVANPPRIIAAPVNYLLHQAEANADGGVHFVKDVKTIDEYGLFLKSSTSLVGPSRGVTLEFPARRNDHEIELVAIIGREGQRIPRASALDHVAGYAIGLDMTVRGPEDRSLRKSPDTFAVLGPWLTTRDEVPDPNALQMRLEVNGDVRQSASTRDLIFDVQRLIEYASSFYRLHPGDLIFTGTPAGVGPVVAGDVMTCTIDKLGTMQVKVHEAER
jgi:2-keto-4-pentenoate hydratase/2-oxohepta-3-ene-1,7-dioic acid hydratase in catechol pathway